MTGQARVETAGSRQAGLDRLKSSMNTDPFEIILLDWKMPVMDGMETIQNGLKRRNGPDI
nr:hypothetical protein [uncultured Desulfobacter sp.]